MGPACCFGLGRGTGPLGEIVPAGLGQGDWIGLLGQLGPAGCLGPAARLSADRWTGRLSRIDPACCFDLGQIGPGCWLGGGRWVGRQGRIGPARRFGLGQWLGRMGRIGPARGLGPRRWIGRAGRIGPAGCLSVDDWIGSGGRFGPARRGWMRAAAVDQSAVPQPSPSAPMAAFRCGSRLRPLLQPTLLSCVLLLGGMPAEPTEPANPYLARTMAAQGWAWAPPPRRACGSFCSALRETSG